MSTRGNRRQTTRFKRRYSRNNNPRQRFHGGSSNYKADKIAEFIGEVLIAVLITLFKICCKPIWFLLPHFMKVMFRNWWETLKGVLSDNPSSKGNRRDQRRKNKKGTGSKGPNSSNKDTTSETVNSNKPIVNSMTTASTNKGKAKAAQSDKTNLDGIDSVTSQYYKKISIIGTSSVLVSENQEEGDGNLDNEPLSRKISQNTSETTTEGISFKENDHMTITESTDDENQGDNSEKESNSETQGGSKDQPTIKTKTKRNKKAKNKRKHVNIFKTLNPFRRGSDDEYDNDTSDSNAEEKVEGNPSLYIKNNESGKPILDVKVQLPSNFSMVISISRAELPAEEHHTRELFDNERVLRNLWVERIIVNDMFGAVLRVKIGALNGSFTIKHLAEMDISKGYQEIESTGICSDVKLRKYPIYTPIDQIHQYRAVALTENNGKVVLIEGTILAALPVFAKNRKTVLKTTGVVVIRFNFEVNDCISGCPVVLLQTGVAARSIMSHLVEQNLYFIQGQLYKHEQVVVVWCVAISRFQRRVTVKNLESNE